jgi:hypothetical protein
MLKTTIKTIVWIAVILAVLTALVGITPTQAGEFVRELWDNVMVFFRSAFGSSTPLVPDQP